MLKRRFMIMLFVLMVLTTQVCSAVSWINVFETNLGKVEIDYDSVIGTRKVLNAGTNRAYAMLYTYGIVRMTNYSKNEVSVYELNIIDNDRIVYQGDYCINDRCVKKTGMGERVYFDPGTTVDRIVDEMIKFKTEKREASL